jgi:MFS family permease
MPQPLDHATMIQQTNNRNLVLVIIASQFAPPFMFSGVAVALPALGRDLHAGATSLSLVETLFLAGSVSFLLPVGRLADASDKNTLFKLGLLGFGITSILIGSLSWMPAILCIRFLQGVTSAVFSATGPAILAEIVPPERRGRAYGGSLGAIYSGLTLGPIIAGFLIDLLNWRAVFFVGATALLVMYLLVQWMLPSAWRRPTKSVHIPSSVLLVAAMLSVVFGTALLGEGVIGYVCVAAGLLLALAFIALQRRIAQPLVDIDALMGHRVLRNALLAQLLLYTNAYCSIFMLSIYMQVSLGHTAKAAGQVIAIGTLLMAIVAPMAGRLADRYRPAAISGFGVVFVLVMALLGTRLHDQSKLVSVGLMLGFQGLGFGLFASPNMTVIMNSVSAGAVSMASALGAKARSLGMVSGMLIVGILVSVHIGHEPVQAHPKQFVQIMTTGYAILAGLTVVALWVCIRMRSQRATAAAE